jgi:septum site-determining protein MinC
VVLKGGRNGVSIVIRDGADFSMVISELREKLAPARNFLGNAPLRVDAGSRTLQPNERVTLVETVHEFGLSITESSEDNSAPRKSNTATGDQSSSRQTEPSTLLHKRTLRSGQQIDFDGNVVVLGDVNPGAVINCSGDIIVFGTLRGVAHAGALGNTKAIVVAFRLQPTQLRIAHFISRAPDGEMIRPSSPEVALVRDECIQIEAYTP